MFHLMFVHYTFSSVLAAGWSPFEGKLPTRLAICSHLSFVYLYFLFISHVCFKSGIRLLIAPGPVHCFSITFTIRLKHSEKFGFPMIFLNLYTKSP